MRTLIVFALLSWGLSAHAQNSSSLRNTSTVVSACAINTTQNLNFGLLDPLTPQPLMAQGSVAVNCTKGTYTLSVNGGVNLPLVKWYTSVYVGGSTGNLYYYKCERMLKHTTGSSALRYDLYTDASMTNALYSEFSVPTYNDPQSCDPRNFTFRQITFVDPGQQIIPVYAKLVDTTVQARRLTAGSYTDTLSFTITF